MIGYRADAPHNGTREEKCVGRCEMPLSHGCYLHEAFRSVNIYKLFSFSFVFFCYHLTHAYLRHCFNSNTRQSVFDLVSVASTKNSLADHSDQLRLNDSKLFFLNTNSSPLSTKVDICWASQLVFPRKTVRHKLARLTRDRAHS